jgi:hypothetical protein
VALRGSGAGVAWLQIQRRGGHRGGGAAVAGGRAGNGLAGGLRNGLTGGLCVFLFFNSLTETGRATASIKVMINHDL